MQRPDLERRTSQRGWFATTNKGRFFIEPAARELRSSLDGRLYLLAGLCATVLLFAPLDAAQAQRARNSLQVHQQEHEELHGKFAQALKELARFCDEKGFADAAAEIRELGERPDRDGLSIELLPSEVQPPIPTDLPADERQWRTQHRHLQKKYAQDLYALSRRTLHAGNASYAFDLVREVARHDPDHRAARQLLGYVRHGDEWVTPYTARMLRSRHVWHDKFGWLPRTHVERYERGERYFNNRWITAEKEAEIRRDFRHAWEVRTDHYLVKTNHSLERGVELAVALEEYHRFFLQMFAGFFNSREQMQKLFEGSTSVSRSGRISRPYEVHYYRTRDEYNRRLIQKVPQIEITNGLYLTGDRVAYFYHDPNSDNDDTLFHEASHQLFYESQSNDRRIAEHENFWIVEGISCYMESFQRENGQLSLGDPRHERLVAARYRYLNDDYYIPLAEFVQMGMHEFQTHPNLSTNYSQASGLAHFFMHYEQGRYRDALIEHLSQIYQGSTGRRPARVQNLAELTGVDFKELDRQYGEYVRQQEASLKRRNRSAE